MQEKQSQEKPQKGKLNLTPEEYDTMRKKASPPSALLSHCVWAFCVGGGICLLGQLLRTWYAAMGFTLGDAATLTSITLVGLSALTTALGWYQKLASKAGAGTLVPITGFANAVVSPAVEFKAEGFVTGTCAKMFVIAGPVIVCGICAGTVYGLVLYFMSMA